MAPSSNDQPQSPYHDRALGPGEIRLVYITKVAEPSLHHVYPWISQHVTLRLVTTRVKLEDEPDFDAVSYVWGTAPASVTVACHGGSLLVTPSAYEMLEQLCVHPRWFWIDAICIDQSNADEKATQIPLMREIYAQATYVVIWMGPSNPAIEAFMDDFTRVVALAKNLTLNIDARRSHPGWRGKEWPRDGDQFWLGLFHLLNHGWFRRLWTFQEAVLGKNPIILCGSRSINGQGFFRFAHEGVWTQQYIKCSASDRLHIPGNPRIAQLAFKACRLISWSHRPIHFKKESVIEAANLSTLLYDLRRLKVQEPVDRVWAIIGLLPDDVQRRIAPMADYSKKGRREYWNTFIRFATVVLSETQSLALLSLPPSLEHDDEKLPSWCTDFTKEHASSMRLIYSWNWSVSQRKASDSRFSYLFHPEDSDEENSLSRQVTITNHPLKLISVIGPDRVLQTRGFVLDIISEVIEDAALIGQTSYAMDSSWEDWYMSNPIHAAAMNMLDRAELLARQLFPESDTRGADFLAQLLMCLLCDCRIIVNAGEVYRVAKFFFTAGRCVDIYSLEKEKQDLVWCMANFLKLWVGHSFFATKKGRLGIATPGCKIGDKVCAFYGGEPLYILRWPGSEHMNGAEHGKGNAVFCGTAFIPYLMEQYQRDDARLGDDEIFSIR
jgi:hypothetical protein